MYESSEQRRRLRLHRPAQVAGAAYIVSRAGRRRFIVARCHSRLLYTHVHSDSAQFAMIAVAGILFIYLFTLSAKVVAKIGNH